MKKTLLILAAFVLSFSLFARDLSMVQLSVLASQRNTAPSSGTLEDTSGFSYPAVGISFQNFRGGFLGFYSNFTFAVPVEPASYVLSYSDQFTYDSYDYNFTSVYDDSCFMMDAMIGPGMFLDLLLPGALASVGLHSNFLYLGSSETDSLYSLTLGIGANFTALLQLGRININASMALGYDMMELVNSEDYYDDNEFADSATAAFSIGVGLKGRKK